MQETTLWLDPLLRWIHVVAGITWIGHLYFFNWVNAQVAKTYDADTKKKVVPELMPRALYFFRWGAAYTWITGLLLLALLYYHGMAKAEGQMDDLLAVVALWVVGPMIYDTLWKSMAKNENAGVAVSFLLLAAAIAGLHFGLEVDGRTLYIHVGALLGTTMAMNVWMRIWPLQKKIIGAIAQGQAPDPAQVALAGLRSKHNTYMSVPLVFTMFALHTVKYYSERDYSWIILIGVIAVGWLAVKWLFSKSASAAPKTY
jgi:uncharacterized membrane protein